MPEARVRVALRHDFSEPEMDSIRAGFVPKEMEDRWFIYWEDNSLFFHRSWTGTCVLRVHFEPFGDGMRTVHCDVNADPEAGATISPAGAPELIQALIESVLLQRPGR